MSGACPLPTRFRQAIRRDRAPRRKFVAELPNGTIIFSSTFLPFFSRSDLEEQVTNFEAFVVTY